MTRPFSPLAVVGQACVLPGASTPAQLAALALEGRDVITDVPAGRFRIHPLLVEGKPGASVDATWSSRGGYVRGVSFDDAGLDLARGEVAGLDPLFHWVLMAGRDALVDAGFDVPLRNAAGKIRAGAVLGNLSFPTEAMTLLGEKALLDELIGRAAREQLGRPWAGDSDVRDRFMSGLPAHILARALHLDAGAFCLDAACASSLYALRLAALALDEGRADVMLAGAVNRADSLFLHVGFCALQALSPGGVPRPFDRRADGLVPAEGCGVVALMRLDDAIRQNKKIHAVIRGIGLSNDGRSRNLLAPSSEGQVRAIRAAWAAAGLNPADPRAVDYLECHATGTPTGDRTEVQTLAEVFAGPREPIPVGSLKSNTGHLITAAGVAGLMKVIASLAAEELPPSLHAEEPLDLLDGRLPFRVQRERAPWRTAEGRPRRAGISAFGFGGNNAHIVVEEHRPAAVRAHVNTSAISKPRLAVVAAGVRIGAVRDLAGLVRAVQNGSTGEAPLEVSLEGLRFPPNDLKSSLAQQLLVFEAARDAAAALPDGALPSLRTGIFVGMGTDVRVTTPGLRWRAPEIARRLAPQLDGAAAASFLRALRDGAMPPMDAQGVLGCMPNIPANRLSVQLDLRGPGFTISAEEHSGLACLDVARALLAAGELDAALVGATDACDDARHVAARASLGGGAAGADGAVVLAVMTEERARSLSLPVLALLDDDVSANALRIPYEAVAKRIGEPHAAAGLFAIAAAVGSVAMRQALPARGRPSDERPRVLEVEVSALDAPSRTVTVREAEPLTAWSGPWLLALGASDRASLISLLQGDVVEVDAAVLARGPWRATVVGTDAADLRAKRERLASLLSSSTTVNEPGLYAREAAPLRRENIAILYGTAGPIVPGMGDELLAAFPDAGDAFAEEIGRKRLAEILALTRYPPERHGGCLGDLAVGSSLMLLYTRIVRDIWKLPFGKTMGVSLGESNAFLAAGAWENSGEVLDEIERERLFDAHLFHEHLAVRAYWKKLGRPEADSAEPWRAVLVRAPAEEVEKLCREPRFAGLVFAIVRHTDDEVEVGGAPAKVEELVKMLGVTEVLLPHVPVIHCDALRPAADKYRALHRRPVKNVDVTVYSHGVMGPVKLDDDSVADALVAQACQPVNFPALLRRIVEDGARVIVDTSPRSLAGKWASRTLAGTGVEVCSLDRGVAGLVNAAARIIVAGAPMEPGRMKPPMHTKTLRLQSPPKPTRMEVPAPRTEVMTPPPPLPRILPAVGDDVVPARNATRGTATGPVLHSAAPPIRTPAAQRAQVDAPVPAALAIDPHDEHGHEEATRAVAAFHELRENALAAHHGALGALAHAQEDFLAHQRAWTERVLALGVSLGDDTSTADSTFAGDVERTESAFSSTNTRESFALWGRTELEHLASGSIADVWGETFRVQDGFRRQVRMPRPPLLLADRVMSVDAQPGVLEKNRSIVTETDIRWDSWFLHEGRCPAGILIETGQADLLLVSYMGVDFENRGDRVYRLLGCDLTYRGPLPLAGTTIQHDIHVDGYATAPMKGGDVRIFFFHSDTWSLDASGQRKDLLLSVRNGQAGFFTDDELKDSGGILWTPADVTPAQLAAIPTAEPPQPTTKKRLGREELVAFSEGDAFTCFGPGFERAATHVRTPRVAPNRLLLVDRVTDLDFRGGPWGRGYLRAELELTGDNWFFDGHFQDDPCMPGTVMFEGCLETLAIYLAGAGFTLSRDAFRFEPVTDKPFKLRCRGQAIPSSRNMVYEVFVRALVDGPEPAIIADILVTVDGLKSLHCDSVELKLVRDWPLSSRPDLLGFAAKPNGDDAVGGVDRDLPAVFDQTALLATGIGRPSEGFPGLYEPFDDAPRVPRLPGPPYHFMSRVSEVTGPALGSLGRGENAVGTRVVVEYDVPPDAWFFREAARSQAETMPFAVLLEIALQPCGFVSSIVGSALTTSEPLYYRNLDGKARLHRELVRDVGTLRITAELLKSSSSGGMIIQELSFDVTLADGTPVFDGTTVFGFFPAEALARQVGAGSTPAERARLAERHAEFEVLDLVARPARYFDDRLALPDPMLLMIDRVTGYDPHASSTSLARVRTEKSIDPREWFFKAHFFQDPVQPGSLGVEAMIQALMWLAIHEKRHEGMTRPRFESLATGEPVVWKYRGQVIPTNKLVQVELDLVSVDEDRASGAVTLRANASLWVDGIKIYLAEGLALRVVDDG